MSLQHTLCKGKPASFTTLNPQARNKWGQVTNKLSYKSFKASKVEITCNLIFLTKNI